MANAYLDIKEMRSNFFSETSMLGVVSPEPGYRFCWILNNYFGLDFANVPENTICLGGNKAITGQQLMFSEPESSGELVYFPTFRHQVPNSSYKYVLYQLKSGKVSLIPEARHLDYLWLFQTAKPLHDAHIMLEELRDIPEIQLVQMLDTDTIKRSLTNLLV